EQLLLNTLTARGRQDGSCGHEPNTDPCRLASTDTTPDAMSSPAAACNVAGVAPKCRASVRMLVCKDPPRSRSASTSRSPIALREQRRTGPNANPWDVSRCAASRVAANGTASLTSTPARSRLLQELGKRGATDRAGSRAPAQARTGLPADESGERIP